MELDEMRMLWQDGQRDIYKKLRVNLHSLDEIQRQKMKSNLLPLRRTRITESVLHLVAIGVLVLSLVNNFSSAPYLIATGSLLAFYIMLLSNSIQQVRLIRRIDYGKDILSIQKSITALQVHSATFLRLLFLFLPAILGWPMIVSKFIQDYNINGLAFMDLSKSLSGNWWQVQLIATLVWMPVCIWLFIKVSPKNIEDPWVRSVVAKTMGRKVVQSMEYLKELGQ